MKNKLCQWIAAKLPKRLVLFTYIQLMAEVTTFGEGKKLSPDEITYSTAYKLFEQKHGKF